MGQLVSLTWECETHLGRVNGSSVSMTRMNMDILFNAANIDEC